MNLQRWPSNLANRRHGCQDRDPFYGHGRDCQLIERIEEMRQVLGSDANASVPHFQKYRTFPHARGDQHTTAFRIVERVGALPA